MVFVREGTLPGGLPYLSIGETGPPLVIFPGLSGENANPTGVDRMTQVRAVRPLARHFTVHIINRRPGLPAGTTIKTMADEYAGAVGRLATPLPVMGISTGGSIAQQFAVDHASLVSRLVLVASACTLSPAGRRSQRRQAELLTAGRPRQAWALAGESLAASAAGGKLIAGLLWLLAPLLTPDDVADFVTTTAAEDEFDSSPELPQITTPTLIIGGARDRFYHPDLFRRTAASIPNAMLRLYRGKGHAGTVGSSITTREVLSFLLEGANMPDQA